MRKKLLLTLLACSMFAALSIGQLWTGTPQRTVQAGEIGGFKITWISGVTVANSPGNYTQSFSVRFNKAVGAYNTFIQRGDKGGAYDYLVDHILIGNSQGYKSVKQIIANNEDSVMIHIGGDPYTDLQFYLDPERALPGDCFDLSGDGNSLEGNFNRIKILSTISNPLGDTLGADMAFTHDPVTNTWNMTEGPALTFDYSKAGYNADPNGYSIQLKLNFTLCHSQELAVHNRFSSFINYFKVNGLRLDEINTGDQYVQIHLQNWDASDPFMFGMTIYFLDGYFGAFANQYYQGHLLKFELLEGFTNEFGIFGMEVAEDTVFIVDLWANTKNKTPGVVTNLPWSQIYDNEDTITAQSITVTDAGASGYNIRITFDEAVTDVTETVMQRWSDYTLNCLTVNGMSFSDIITGGNGAYFGAVGDHGLDNIIIHYSASDAETINIYMNKSVLETMATGNGNSITVGVTDQYRNFFGNKASAAYNKTFSYIAGTGFYDPAVETYDAASGNFYDAALYAETMDFVRVQQDYGNLNNMSVEFSKDVGAPATFIEGDYYIQNYIKINGYLVKDFPAAQIHVSTGGTVGSDPVAMNKEGLVIYFAPGTAPQYLTESDGFTVSVEVLPGYRGLNGRLYSGAQAARTEWAYDTLSGNIYDATAYTETISFTGIKLDYHFSSTLANFTVEFNQDLWPVNNVLEFRQADYYIGKYIKINGSTVEWLEANYGPNAVMVHINNAAGGSVAMSKIGLNVYLDRTKFPGGVLDVSDTFGIEILSGFRAPNGKLYSGTTISYSWIVDAESGNVYFASDFAKTMDFVGVQLDSRTFSDAGSMGLYANFTVEFSEDLWVDGSLKHGELTMSWAYYAGEYIKINGEKISDLLARNPNSVQIHVDTAGTVGNPSNPIATINIALNIYVFEAAFASTKLYIDGAPATFTVEVLPGFRGPNGILYNGSAKLFEKAYNKTTDLFYDPEDIDEDEIKVLNAYSVSGPELLGIFVVFDGDAAVGKIDFQQANYFESNYIRINGYLVKDILADAVDNDGTPLLNGLGLPETNAVAVHYTFDASFNAVGINIYLLRTLKDEYLYKNGNAAAGIVEIEFLKDFETPNGKYIVTTAKLILSDKAYSVRPETVASVPGAANDLKVVSISPLSNDGNGNIAVTIKFNKPITDLARAHINAPFGFLLLNSLLVEPPLQWANYTVRELNYYFSIGAVYQMLGSMLFDGISVGELMARESEEHRIAGTIMIHLGNAATGDMSVITFTFAANGDNKLFAEDLLEQHTFTFKAGFMSLKGDTIAADTVFVWDPVTQAFYANAIPSDDDDDGTPPLYIPSSIDKGCGGANAIALAAFFALAVGVALKKKY
ncbi:MAG: hypothetical protein FWE62_03320 [Firmicutes bacterium]|nr:hypothetical protein [Bacillota bacterium]